MQKLEGPVWVLAWRKARGSKRNAVGFATSPTFVLKKAFK
jgi:hypothetical protein